MRKNFAIVFEQNINFCKKMTKVIFFVFLVVFVISLIAIGAMAAKEDDIMYVNTLSGSLFRIGGKKSKDGTITLVNSYGGGFGGFGFGRR